MQYIKVDNGTSIAQTAVDMIVQAIQQKPHCVLGLATGSTPIATYKELIKRYEQGNVDFSQVTTFNLDEYYGLAASHPQSYHTYMYHHLFKHINIKKQNIHILDGTTKQIEKHCEQYENKIKACGGIDLQLLGIGRNGHIGFNEPAEQLQPRTHLARLSKETVQANSRFFTNKKDVPQYAITMGVRTILAAKKIVLLAEGHDKAEIIEKLFQTGITTDIPASFLRLHHDVTVIVDERAGSKVNTAAKELR